MLPDDIELSSIITMGSGRPYNILAGVDLNGDGDGGATDRARPTLADIATSVQRNAGTLPAQAAVDLRLARRFPVGRMQRRRDLRGVQPLQSIELHGGEQRIRHGVVSRPVPLPTFGQFTQAAPPRQMQLAVKIGF